MIGAKGKVTEVDVRESTLADKAVERCIKSRIARWIFPEPSGGGVVEVNYPFILRSS